MFGGVVPEIASRVHLTSIVPVVERTVVESGLAGAMWTRLPSPILRDWSVRCSSASATQRLSPFALDRPLVAVHHLEAHLFATALEHPDAVPPFTALLVSGGHTLLLDVAAWGDYRLLGAPVTMPPVKRSTRSPSCSVCRIREAGTSKSWRPRGPGSLSFHTPHAARRSAARRPGLLRPVVQWYQDRSAAGGAVASDAGRRSRAVRADIARGFQDAVIETLVEKTVRAATACGRRRIVLGGGVACNRALVAAMRSRGRTRRDGVCPVSTPRHRQRGHDRARRPVSPRSRRHCGTRPHRLRVAPHPGPDRIARTGQQRQCLFGSHDATFYISGSGSTLSLRLPPPSRLEPHDDLVPHAIVHHPLSYQHRPPAGDGLRCRRATGVRHRSDSRPMRH